MCAITGIGSLIGSFFTADAGAAAGTAATAAGAADAAAIPTITVTAAGAGAGAGVGSTAAVAGGAAAAAGGAAAATSGGTAAPAATPPSRSIATTVGEASAVSSGASALYTLSQGPGRINVPPVPVNQLQTDITVQNAEQQQLARREAAGGLQSTIGTPGGQAGAVLNPSTLSNRSILGG